MTNDDNWLNYYVPPDTPAPSLPAGPEGAIPWIPSTTPRYEPPAPKRRNAWAPVSLAIALVALVFEWAVMYEEHFRNLSPYVVGTTGENEPPHAYRQGGPVWLQGYFLSSWWEAAALLLIAFAVGAGVRSLTLVVRHAARGLGFTVSGFLVSSLALIAGQAQLVGLLGVTASLAVLGIYSGARGSEGAVATNSAFVSGPALAADPTAARQRARAPSQRMAIMGFVGAWLLPLLAIVTFVFAIVTLRRMRATGEAGRGWAIAAIVVSSVWLVVTLWILFLAWLLSQVKWT